MRLESTQKHLIEQGAALRGMSVSDFVIQSVAQAAEQVVRQQQLITLTLEGQQAFLAALENPPVPGPALKEAFKSYQRMNRSDD